MQVQQRYTIIASPKSRLAADCLFASAFSILSLPSPNSHIPRDKKQFQPGLRHPFGYSSRHMSSANDIRLLPTDTFQPETVCFLVAAVPQPEISFSPARCSGRNVLEETQIVWPVNLVIDQMTGRLAVWLPRLLLWLLVSHPSSIFSCHKY
jgi:hypothetical protein